jgi:hypothetical protein
MSRNTNSLPNPIKPFMLKHYDFKWPDELRKRDQNAYYLDLIREYRKGDTVIKAKILNLSSFDKGEGCEYDHVL